MITDLRTWLQQAAWPLWLAEGIDRAQGGFHESLPNTADFRRLRVVARQTYVFSEAHRAGVAGAEQAVSLGAAYLAHHAAHPDGGYAWRFSLDNKIIDPTRDLYDQAFVLLALASAAQVLPPAALRTQALTHLAWLDDAMAHPAGGYHEALPVQPGVHRRQNPHMHLLEALLAAHEVFGDAVFLTRAGDLVALFLHRLFDPAIGALPEYFDAAWQPIRHQGAYLIEPGHHCEWVWLLDRYISSTGPDPRVTEASDALMRFVDVFGAAPAGGLAAGVTSTGQLHDASTRLWAQAERVKAELIRPGGAQARQRAAVATLSMFLRPDGTWHERRDAAGAFIPGPAPATSLYHLTSAILTAEHRVLTHPVVPHTSTP